MKFEEFKNEVMDGWKKEFPESKIEVRGEKCLGSSIWITCYIAKDRTETAHGIMDNDMLGMKYVIHLKDTFNFESDELPEWLFMEVLGNSYEVKPTNEYYYCANKKATKARKTKGNAEKIIKTLNKNFKELKENLIEEVKNDNILEDHIELLKKKLYLVD